MKAEELRQLTPEELEQKKVHFVEELFNLRFQRVAGKLENPSRMKEVRRTIARIETIKRQSQIANDGTKMTNDK